MVAVMLAEMPFSVTPARCYSRRHCGDTGFVGAGPRCSSADTSTMQVSSGAFVRNSTQMVVEQFCSLAVHASSIKRHGPTGLQHIIRFCIALRIICGRSTTFIHDGAKQLPISVWQLVWQCSFCTPWPAHAERIVKLRKNLHFICPSQYSLVLFSGDVWLTEILKMFSNHVIRWCGKR